MLDSGSSNRKIRTMVTKSVTITIEGMGKMGRFNIEEYETVGERIARAHADHPDLRIVTDLVEVVRDPETMKPLQYIVRAQVWYGDVLKAVDYAEEIVGNSPVNKTSALENACTSAIGRALADANYQGTDPRSKRPSREEMEKVQRAEVASVSVKEVVKVVYTPEQIDEAKKLAEAVGQAIDVDTLKSIYQEANSKGLLHVGIGDASLNSVIVTAKKSMEANK